MSRQSEFEHRGFGLIEVLVSMLVFMLGVLGVAGMQGQALRVSHDSVQRSQAVWMAHEISERMKVNPEGFDLDSYQIISAAASANVTAACNAPPPTQCIGIQCSPGQMAVYDIYDLLCNGTGVINPRLLITCSATPCAPGAVVTVNLSWDSRGATGGLNTTRQQLTLALRR